MLPPSFRKVDPSGVADPVLRAPDQHAAAAAARRVRRDRSWPSGSPPSTAWPRCRSSARRSTRCGSSSIPSSSRRATSASTRWRRRCRTATSTCRPAFSGAPTRRIRWRARASSPTPPGFGALVVAYRDGAPVRLGDLGGWWTACRTPSGRAGTTGSAPSCSPSSASPAPTPWRWPSGSRPRSSGSGPRCRPRSRSPRCTIAPRPSKASVHDVKFTLFLALCLVVMVIFLFLRNLRATMIPSLALPMSLVGTFAVMYLLGYSLDNLSLMALTLAVGFVVDDAIVVLENIVRHIEKGEPVMQAAINGSREISFTVHLDDAVAGGGVHPGAVPGRPHRPAVPGVRRHHRRGDPGVRLRLADPDPDALQPLAQARARRTASTGGSTGSPSGPGKRSLAWYERTCAGSWTAAAWRWRSALLHPGRHASCWAGSCPRDSSRARTRASSPAPPRPPRAPATTPWSSTSRRRRRSCRRIPTSTGFMSSVGAGGRSSTVNQGRLIIHLKPRGQRTMSADEVARSLTRKLAAVPGHAGVHHQSAGDQHRRPAAPRATTSSPCRARTSRRCTRARPRWSSGCTRCPGSPTSPATCRSRTPRSRWPSTATGRRRWAST